MTRTGILCLLVLILMVTAFSPVFAQVGPVITSPRQGEALQGILSIQGSSDVAGFALQDVSFAYASDRTGTWFQIASSDKPVKQDVIATWDTTTITDGDYVLRLRVYLQDGSSLDFTVPNLRVRNYTPIETSTPASTE
jgi:hypothetical protein